jgi:DNA repair protein RadC
VKKSFTIHDFPLSERPRERLKRLGVEAMSAQELLSLILERGTYGDSLAVIAQRLLSEFSNIKGISEASIEELSRISGISIAKAAQLKAAFELARRLESSAALTARNSVKTPEDLAALVKNRLKGKNKKYFLIISLDTRNKLIKLSEISIGSLDTSIVHPREVFREAMSSAAASVILVHNHPSGDT